MVLWILLGISVGIILYTMQPVKESFVGFGGSIAGVSLQKSSNEALDRAPSTSEVKDDYKLLLIYSAAAMRKGGQESVLALRVLADLRDRLYDKHDFREKLVTEDFKGNWPSWLPPIDTTIEEPTYTCADASTAEAHILAYLQKNFPQEANVDEQTGSTIRNIVEDFGYRFVFKRGEETVELSKKFLVKPLLKGWISPCQQVPDAPVIEGGQAL